ncbi:MAG: HEAT repeat domain-containing protein [Candidatus Hydrogenedentes bacterium]|nr:HEAT repeat domain-containing protein [Candidatus Hydrogenedentota bacterium]
MAKAAGVRAMGNSGVPMLFRFLTRRVPVLLIMMASVAAFAAPEAAPRPYNPPIAPASDEGVRAMKNFSAPEGFVFELFAAEPRLANPVAFHVDHQGNFYVAETYRHHKGVGDMRGHREWLVDDLASRTVEDRLVVMKKNLGADFANWVGEHDRIKMIRDTDGDGEADVDTVFADGFMDALTGIGAGLLADRGSIYYTCIPELWRLVDEDGDGKADQREVLSSGYGVHINFLGHDLHGLRKGPDGRLYFTIGDRGVSIKNPDGSRLEEPDTGAVFRCNMDGSGLEIVHRGLRNPQELAFDNYGNLFTGDNNSDGGDQARWVWIVEGGDSGWRIGYQWVAEPNPRGPWNAEKMWEPWHEGQPAHIVPPILNIGAGPSGLTFYPGTGMSSAYNDTFFLADFRGDAGRSLIHAFQVQPKGAGFELVNRRDFANHMLVTDVEFGMEPGIYFSDWTQGWDQPMKGRLYRIYESALEGDALHTEAVRLLGEGMAQRKEFELEALLGHADQRVRLEAQYALADLHAAALPIFSRAATGGKSLMARIHGVWGQWQLILQGDADATALVPLLEDESEEIRVQAARVLGDAAPPLVLPLLRKALGDSSPRVQFHAATSIGRLGVLDHSAASDLVELLRSNDNTDPNLRHAAVVGLQETATTEMLAALSLDPSPAVRLGGLLALRRLKSPEAGRFLIDSDPLVVEEAVRAIHDEMILDAYPALAALAEHASSVAFEKTYTWRRIVNAHFRLGQSENAATLARLATAEYIPEIARLGGLKALAAWSDPPALDPVTGEWRPRKPGTSEDVQEAVSPRLEELIQATSPELLLALASVCENHKIPGVEPTLATLVMDEATPVESRVRAMQYLGRMDGKRLRPLLEKTLDDGSELVRAESISQIAALDQPVARELIPARIESGGVAEKQAAIQAISTMDESLQEQLLVSLLEKLSRGGIDGAVQLDLLQTAEQAKPQAVKDALARREAPFDPNDLLAAYRPALLGGVAEKGRKIFFERAETQCLRCHSLEGQGGSQVGPELTGIGARVDREHILAAIVTPNAAIAAGFENVSVTLADGTYITGRLLQESETELVLEVPEEEDPFEDWTDADKPHSEVDVVAENSGSHGEAGGAVVAAPGTITKTIPKSSITARERALSSMPEGLAQFITLSELRDLVEFLASRK